MNLTEDNYESNKNTKTMKILVVSMVLVMLISFGIMGAIYYLQKTEFKFTIDGVSQKNPKEDLFIFEGDKVYISIKDIAPLVKYTAYNGLYGNQQQYSEDITKCYVEGENEVASFELNSNIIYKITTDGKGEYEYFEIDEPVVQVNNKLYTTILGIDRAFNLLAGYDKNNNKMTINTLPSIVKSFKTENIETQSFNNQKALLYNLKIVSNVASTTTSNVRYGVYTLSGTEIIGTKYQSIEFVESTQEFLVKTTDGKVGIITNTGITKIQPQYDELKQIDKNLELYLATNNGKQGILQENGKILVYIENDKIGLDVTKFSVNNIKNPYLLYNNCIPVCKNNKWGLYDKKGKLILPIEYDYLGCIVSTSSADSIVLIPEIKGIVVGKNVEGENNKTQKCYGVVNYQGKEIIPLALTSIYSVTNLGKQEYYMVNIGRTLDVIEWVNKYRNINEINVES